MKRRERVGGHVTANYVLGLQPQFNQEIGNYTGNLYKAVPRFGEFCLCYCLPLLTQLACFFQPGNGLKENPCTCTEAQKKVFVRGFVKFINGPF